ncbi:MAG: glycosyltransferase family 39 protein [Melioribacteraceae bacterium]|nr:glycosyltransferase family 39 protein [Melioribacteraceae bacterium]
MIFNKTFLSSKNNFYKFVGILFIVKLVYLFFIPITPQEAYYWFYSQNLDWSYFDHPPMAAYSIWLGTNIFGDNIFGVKFMAVVWYLLTSLLLYKTVSRFTESYMPNKNKNMLAFLSVLLYNLTLFAHIYAITIVPDTPLIFFWLLTIYAIQERIITENKNWWLLAAVGLGLGLVSKYTAVVIIGAIFFFFLFSKKYRKELLSPYPYLAIIIGFIIFAPVIYWNYERGWASFLFQSAERADTVRQLRITYILQLLGSQLFMLTPLLFIYLFKSFSSIIKRWKENENMHLYFWSAIIIIGGFTLVSLTSLVKMNWLLPGFLPLIAIVTILFSESFLNRSKLIKIGIWTSIVLVFAGHIVMVVPNIPLGNGNTWSGWEDAAEKIYEIQQERGGNENVFIFSNGYKAASLMKFYLPDQQNTYAENIYGKRALQFDYWGIPNRLKGKDAIYVRSNRTEYDADLNEIKKYFDEVVELETFDYKFVNGKSVRKIICYYAKNYKGPN